MSLDTLNATVDSIREDAAATQKSYGQQVTEIQNDPHLSVEGRQAKLADVNAAAKDSLSALRSKESEAIDVKVRDIEKQIDAKAGWGAADIIAFRDAQDRAERLENADDALRVLERAIRTEDTVLAHAIFRRGIDAGYTNVITAFGDAYPDKKDIVGELAYLKEAQKNTFVRGMHYMWMNR